MTLGVHEPPPDQRVGAVRTPAPAERTLAAGGVPEAGGTSVDGGMPGNRGFRFGLAGAVVVGAVIQWAVIDHVAATTGPSPQWRFTRLQAMDLIHGYWFANPFWLTTGIRFGQPAHIPLPSALHVPLPTLVLAAVNLAGATTWRAQMVAMALLFLVAVVLGGLAVRDLAGDRAGILAAVVLATFPTLWVSPVSGPVETVVIIVIVLLLWGCLRFWRAPSVRGAVEMGFYLGLAAITRLDLAALVVLVGIPLVLLVRGLGWPGRVRCLLAMGALVVLVVGPWIGRNLQTFTATVALSDDPGLVVGGANCPATYQGALLGWTSPACPGPVRVATAEAVGGPGDEAVATSAAGHDARVYLEAHRGRLTEVLAARLGRMWNVYRPGQQIGLETAFGRPRWASVWGLWYFYVAVPLAIAGAVILRRRRALVFPFLALVVTSSVTALVAYGDARFRVEADVALALLAAVALDAIWAALADRRRAPTTGRPAIPTPSRGRHAAPAR